MKIEVRDLIGAKYATNPNQGQRLYDLLVSCADKEKTVSFKNIELVSTAFLNRSLGKFTQNFPKLSSKLNFIYPSKNHMIELKVKDVIENATLGDSYDQLVDVAEHEI